VRGMSLSRFISLWTHPDYAPDAVTEGELERVERRLETRLPADYKSAVLQFGLPRPTIELLDAIVDRQLDLREVSDFLGPAEMVTVTKDWRDLGLPEELVAFATDCMGNLFCFSAAAEAFGEMPVFFFDHDERSVDVVAPSFTQWVDDFCGVAPH
jgi:cell wall assembly regulator SMI1